MANSLLRISDDRVRQLLDWQSTARAVETALVAVSQKRVFQKPRVFTNILGKTDLLLCMPGYIETDTSNILACKMVTAFSKNMERNPSLPSVMANILLFDENTGELKCVMEATEITAWRTAAASVIGTKYLHFRHPERRSDILAILGAGTQGRIHALAFHHFFKFNEIRIWNHRVEKAEILVKELIDVGVPARLARTGRECVEDADVIITATFAASPIVELEWVKRNVHINAVGAGTVHYSELGESLYKKSLLYVDHMESAKLELKGLEDMGVKLQAEIGELIIKACPMPDHDKITIFQSMGMAVEDAAVGQMIYDRYMEQK